MVFQEHISFIQAFESRKTKGTLTNYLIKKAKFEQVFKQKLLVNLLDLVCYYYYVWSLTNSEKKLQYKIDRMKCCCLVPKFLVQVGFMIVGNMEIINKAI